MPSLYEQITNIGEPITFDDIMASNMSGAEKKQAINERTTAYNKALDRQKWKDIGRGAVGTAISGASFLPIFNIPYVGTGIGGAMYDLGQGIVEGDKAKDLGKRTARGFAIGETVGAIPYVGKGANRLSGGRIGNAIMNSKPAEMLNKAGEKFADSKLYDYLMTDIRAFNPNKQIAFHGSPYDFNKFSNEAIGTGEGAQAHGYGHYAAFNKGTAEGYADRLGHYKLENPDKISLPYGTDTDLIQANYFGKEEQIRRLKNQIEINENLLKTEPENSFAWQAVIDNLTSRIENIDKYFDKLKVKADKQLYKLSIPNDNVLLREGDLFNDQPQAVQDKLWDLAYELQDKGGRGKRNLLNALAENKSGKQIYETIWDMYDDADIYGASGASRLLDKAGIKGISYNGGIDGEAAVIFNPDDIVIGRKFYNQPDAIAYVNKLKSSTGATADALSNFVENLTKQEKKQLRNKWRQYAKDNLIGNSVDIPEYTTVDFTNANLGKDFLHNLPEYQTLLDDLQGAKYHFSTNYNDETDRLYDHLLNKTSKGLFDYLVEVVKDKENNIHHNYKMMKNLTKGDRP